MNGKNIRQILKKYLLGNASADEVNAIDHWYQSFENDVTVMLTAQEREAAKQEIWEKIAPAIEVNRKVRTIPVWLKAVSWAAVAAGIVFTLFLLTRPAKQALAYTTIATKNGERATVTIQDGTRLTLNAGTTLHVYNDFSGERRVDLVDGEVFFEVKHDEHRPFRIHSSDLTISVLGTTFDVSAYTGLKKVNVGVVTGRVGVKRDTTTLDVLTKNRQLMYDTEKHSYVTGATNESLLAWREGRIVLNDLSFGEMVVLMKKNFGIDIITHNNNIEQTQYTSELFTTMTAREAVEVLAAIHQLGIQKIDEHTWLFK